MDNFHLLNDDAKNYYFSKKHIATRAEKWILKDYLSILQISILLFPLDKSKNRKQRLERNKDIKIIKTAYINQLIKACKKGTLEYEGNIDGWEFQGKNTYPMATKGSIKKVNGKSFHICAPHCCTIHKNEFKKYLGNSSHWPIDSLLANWWLDEKDRAELKNDLIKKKEKYVKPKQRDTDTLTSLIYEIIEQQNIKMFSQLKGKEAWELIITDQIKSPFIKEISESKKYFILKINRYRL